MFRSEKDFQLALDRLNAINNQWMQWQETTARKDHKDEFGDLIVECETYFSMALPGSVSSNARMSRKSMATYLALIFKSAPALETLGDERRAARDGASAHAINSLR